MFLPYVILFFYFLAPATSKTVELVPGWSLGKLPTPGVVYWVWHKGRYHPFVFIDLVKSQCRSIRMSDSRTPSPNQQFSPFQHPEIRSASDFFGKNVELQVGPETAVSLNTYFLFPREWYKVVNPHPDDMKIWRGHITKLSEEGLERLIAAADGMVEGWNELYPESVLVPVLGLVYWLLPRDLGYPHTEAGVYIPCVVIAHDGDKCLVTCLYKGSQGEPAWKFFGMDVMLPTPQGTVSLEAYSIFPGYGIRVEAKPKIMQLWNFHHTYMRAEKVQKLADINRD